MKRRIFSVLIAILLIATIMVPATAALAAKPGGEKEALNNAIVLGADLHLSRQGTYGGIPNTWEWKIGTGATGPNVQGISATGLSAAYEKTKDARYLNGAIKAGNTLVSLYDANASRPYSQDVEFLVRLAKDSNNKSYAEKAAVYYARVISYRTAVEIVNYYITGRKSLAGWDLASQIRAAWATNNKDYARAIADELLRRSTEWVGVPYGGWDYTVSGYASLLWSLCEIGGNNDVIKNYRQLLLNAQGDDGSWDDGDFQTTAYAILGLSEVKGKEHKDALASAANFLIDSQTDLGGWFYAGWGESGEVNSEALMALGELKGDEGLHKGHQDNPKAPKTPKLPKPHKS